MEILSKYLAPWAIPNENIPLHVVWNPDDNIQEINLIKPDNLSVKEVFNASYIEDNEEKVRFYNFSSDGYLSIELTSKLIENLEETHNIYLEFLRDEVIIKKINLSTKILRPELEPIFIPEILNITEVNGELTVNSPIKIQYQGVGMTYVHIKTTDNSDLQIEVPEDMQKSIKKFNEDLELCLTEIKPKYPQYKSFFDTMNKSELTLEFLESELDVFSDIFINDMEFTKDISEKLSWAISRNYATFSTSLKNLTDSFI